MLTPSYLPIKGGVETLVKNYSTRLNQIGVTTDILTFNMNQKWNPKWQESVENSGGLKIYQSAGLNWFPYKHSDRITFGVNLIPGRFRYHLKNYDIAHFHIGDLTFPVFSAFSRIPKIAHFHGPLDFYKTHFPSRLILKNMANLYIAITKSMQSDLITLGVPPEKIRYVPNAVDTHIFVPGEKKDENILLFVGRITYGKGVHVLLKALKYLKTKVHLVIIGPPDWDPDYFTTIMNQIDSENSRGFHQVTYLGEQGEATIAEWCQKATLFVLPSFREAFGVAILEALACETPVVASHIPGIREAVSHGTNGILVQVNNPLNLSVAIQYLLDNDKIRTSFGKEGRASVVKNFSFDVIIRELKKIYNETSLTC